MLAVNISVKKRAKMIGEYKRKDLQEKHTEKYMEVLIKKRTIFVSLMVLCIVIVAMQVAGIRFNHHLRNDPLAKGVK